MKKELKKVAPEDMQAKAEDINLAGMDANQTGDLVSILRAAMQERRVDIAAPPTEDQDDGWGSDDDW